jgi:hypothetical protein
MHSRNDFLLKISRKISPFESNHLSALHIKFQFLPQGEHSELQLETQIGEYYIGYKLLFLRKIWNIYTYTYIYLYI